MRSLCSFDSRFALALTAAIMCCVTGQSSVVHTDQKDIGLGGGVTYAVHLVVRYIVVVVVVPN